MAKRKKVMMAAGVAVPVIGMAGGLLGTGQFRANAQTFNDGRAAAQPEAIRSPHKSGGNLYFAAQLSTPYLWLNQYFQFHNHTSTKRVERLRFRSRNGALKKTTYLGGTIEHSNNSITYSSNPDYSAYSICAAVVEASHESVIISGPLCLQS